MAVALLNRLSPVSIEVQQGPMAAQLGASRRTGVSAAAVAAVARFAFAVVRGQLRTLLALTRVLRQPRPFGIREEERWW
jgi:hypothetical protein